MIRKVVAQVAALLALIGSSAHAANNEMVVAVFDPVDNDHLLGEHDGQALADHVAGLVGRIVGISVVPRDSIQRIVQEEKAKSYATCHDEACQIELGKTVAAQKSFVLHISRLGGACVIRADLLDLKKEASEWSNSLTRGCGASEIVLAFAALVEDFRMARSGDVTQAKAQPPNTQVAVAVPRSMDQVDRITGVAIEAQGVLEQRRGSGTGWFVARLLLGVGGVSAAVSGVVVGERMRADGEAGRLDGLVARGHVADGLLLGGSAALLGCGLWWLLDP